MGTARTLAGTGYLWTVSLLTNVTMRLYLMMTPFLSVSSGGSHLTITDVEVRTSITTFVGGPAGAVIGIDKCIHGNS